MPGAPVDTFILRPAQPTVRLGRPCPSSGAHETSTEYPAQAARIGGGEIAAGDQQVRRQRVTLLGAALGTFSFGRLALGAVPSCARHLISTAGLDRPAYSNRPS
jgi:hypothetical protein